MQFGLTVKRIARLKQKGRYSDGSGLYLQVNESGSKSWVFKYERTLRDGNGQPKRKEHMMGLGGLATFGLAEARERARCCASRSRTASIRLRPSARQRPSANWRLRRR